MKAFNDSVDRREFITRAGVAAIAGVAVSCGQKSLPVADQSSGEEWDNVRAQFNLARDKSTCARCSSRRIPNPCATQSNVTAPRSTRTRHFFLREQLNGHENQVLQAAGEYLGANPAQVALTDSTTMGLGLVYNGLELLPGQQILTTIHDYYATHESLRLAAERSGAQIRETQLYQDEQTVTTDEIVTNIRKAIAAETRVLALTWVHSSTGLKLPLKEIAAVVKEANTPRDEQQRILMCVDGVHGFGVEDVNMTDLGCDFFMAGCHKWLFGPRGTGIIWGNEREWSAVSPIIPTFMDDASRDAWLRDDEPPARARRRGA